MFNFLTNAYIAIFGIFAFQAIIFGIKYIRYKDLDFQWLTRFCIATSLHAILFYQVFTTQNKLQATNLVLLYIMGLFTFGSYIMSLNYYLKIKSKLLKNASNILFFFGLLLSLIALINLFQDENYFIKFLPTSQRLILLDYQLKVVPSTLLTYFSVIGRIVTLASLFYILMLGKVQRDKWLLTGVIFSIFIFIHNSITLLGYFEYFIPLLPFMNLIELCRFSWLSLDSEKLNISHIQDKVMTLEKNLEANKKLKTLGENTASIIHDLAGPVFVIQSQTQCLEKELSVENSKEAKKRLQKILKSCDRLSSMLTQKKEEMLNINKLKKENLIHILQESIENIQPKLEKRKIKLTLTNPAFSPEALIHKENLVRIFNNMLTNSYEHIEALDPKERWIKIDFKIQEELIIMISNGGSKIQQSDTERIFELYFTTKPLTGGSGFGLSICKRLLHEMGGDISYNNKANHPQFILSFSLTESHSTPLSLERTDQLK